jgi:uncharacterized protein (TIRG00374 family)
MAHMGNGAGDAAGRHAAPPARQPGVWGRWLLALGVAGLLWFFVSRRAEVEAVVRTLARGQWGWLLAAALLQAASYTLYALDYRQAFRSVGIRERALSLLPILLASLAVGEVAPVGWAAGSAVFVRYAVGKGSPPERAAIGTLLAQAADLLAFTAAFVLGMAFLFLQHDLQPAEIAGAVMLLCMNAALGTVLLLALWQPGILPRLLRRLPSRTVDRAKRLAEGLAATAAEVRSNPQWPATALSAALGAHVLNVVSLYLVFLAFHQSVGLGVLVTGYGIGTLAWMASPVPAGVGVVEGAMALAYTSLGVPAGSAAVIAIAYRGLSFWLPLIAGIVFLRRLEPRRG